MKMSDQQFETLIKYIDTRLEVLAVSCLFPDDAARIARLFEESTKLHADLREQLTQTPANQHRSKMT